MSLMICIMIVLLGVFACVIAIPVISLVIYNKDIKSETVYEFPKELIDSDYPDIEFFEIIQEDFEKRKNQIFSKELP